jgi:hypothetical protein
MSRMDLARSKDLEAHLATPIVVSGHSESGARFNEYAYTETVSANSCLITLRTPVRNEQLLLVTNAKTAENILCRVAICVTNGNESTLVKLSFVSPSQRFWRLTFPPESSNPTSREEE